VGAAVFDILPGAVMFNRAAEIIYTNDLCARLMAAEIRATGFGRCVKEYLMPLPGLSLAPNKETRFLGFSKVLRSDRALVEVVIFGGFIHWGRTPATFLLLGDVTERRDAARNRNHRSA
jgi:hypothetical protein